MNWSFLRIPAAFVFVAIALVLFVFSAIATASDGQGALVFLVTFPASMALLSLGAAFTRRIKTGWGRISYYCVLGTFSFYCAFLACAFIPGLNRFTDAVMSGVVYGYEAHYGMSPYLAHHPQVDLPGLVTKALEASNGESLDLRGLNLQYPWIRLCLFRPYTSDEAAMKAAGLPHEWKLSQYSKVDLNDGFTAIALLRQDYPVYVFDLPRSIAEFPDSLNGRCVEKAKALFRREKPAGNGLGPTLTLAP